MKLFFLLFFFAMVAVQVEARKYVEACNLVCDRIERERNECCRAHGYRGMEGGRCNRGRAFCK